MNAALELYPHGRIVILAGEGTEGNFSTYHGKRTERAIKSRLTRERCSGDRWAHAYIYIHTNDGGDVYAGLDIDNERHLSDSDID